MLLGCIADDFTDDSDLANTLAKEGMATTQFMGIPQNAASTPCETGVVPLKTRTIPAARRWRNHWLLCTGCWRRAAGKSCSSIALPLTPHRRATLAL